MTVASFVRLPIVAARDRHLHGEGEGKYLSCSSSQGGNENPIVNVLSDNMSRKEWSDGVANKAENFFQVHSITRHL